MIPFERQKLKASILHDIKDRAASVSWST